MAVFEWLSHNIFEQTAIFMAILVAVGLKVQKKTATEILEGFVLTFSGYIIFNQGLGIICNALFSINDILMPTINSGVGVYPESSNVTSWAMTIEYVGSRIMGIFIVSWFIHILIVRVFHNAFKVVYLTVHMMMATVACNALFWHFGMGFTGWKFYLPCIVLSVLYFTLSPMLIYKDCMEITEGAFALGHLQQVGAWFGGKLASLVGDPEKDNADNLELPGWLRIFNNTTVNLAITMPITFIIIGIICMVVGNATAMEVLEANRGTTNTFIWLITQGVTFAAGTTVLLFGLRMFLGNIVPGFQGLTDKIMPGVIPAIDCAAFFAFSPMGVMISFLSYAVGGILVSVGCLVFHSNVFVFPSIALAFFDGGTIGVFANYKGGWKGCILAGFVCGVLMHLGALAIVPLIGEAGVNGVTFGNFDTNVIFTGLFHIINMVR